MKIASWNVNSIRARLPNVLEWFKDVEPDVVLLQEIKCETDSFPKLEFESMGYTSHILGQKSYNGVAILTRHKAEDIREHLPENESDPQSRYIEATIQGIRIASIYLPNGNPIDTEKFSYKLSWMQRLKAHAAHLLKSEMPIVLGGDFNIIPESVDVYDPKSWENDALFHPDSRGAFRQIIQLGYTEAFRSLNPDMANAYTFWDYQAGAWQRDNGIRIDHFLLSAEAADRLISCTIDRAPRGKEKASDHTPILMELRK